MHKVTSAVFLCCAGLTMAPDAHAAGTRVVFQASVDGGSTWHASVNALPGSQVTFRIVTSLVNNTGAGSVPVGGGLATLNIRPTLSNWTIGDQVVPFDPEGFGDGASLYIAPSPPPAGTLVGPGVRSPNVNGRLAPFASNGTNGNGLPQGSVDGGVLTFRSAVIANNGVSINQHLPSASGVQGWDGHTWTDGTDLYTNPTPTQIANLGLVQNSFFAGSVHNFSRTNVVGFRYTITLDANNLTERTLTQSGAFLNAGWCRDLFFGTQPVPLETLTAATVNVIPAPGATAMLLVGAVVSLRRRRLGAAPR